MNLTTEQIKKLTEKYPFLIPYNVWTGKVDSSYDYSYIAGLWEIPEGWHRLFLLYCKNLYPYLKETNMLEKYRFSQIKEKYGTLRIYDFGYPVKADHLSTLFECFSRYVCPYCGKYPTTHETTGWVTFLCDTCAKNSNIKTVKLPKPSKICKIETYEDHAYVNLQFTYKHIKREYDIIYNMSDEEFFNYLIVD